MLPVSLDPRDRRPLYLQIMDEVRRALIVGSLRAKDPVPSVRETSQLVVNPRTVLQAYRELEREGVLYVRREQGTFVAPDAPTVGGWPARWPDAARRPAQRARCRGAGRDDSRGCRPIPGWSDLTGSDPANQNRHRGRERDVTRAS